MSTLSITTNTSALSVQRNLSKANDRSASSLAKLSSGSRVPTARDDAASLAIGSRLEAEVAGLNQASVNASQATSMLQIADGALSEINDILVRLKSLSVQSSSGQLSDSERTLLDSEFQQLLSEVDRITDDTEFNGNPLLNGGDTKASTDEYITGSLASKGVSVSYDTNIVVGKDDFNNDGDYIDPADLVNGERGDTKGEVYSVSYDQGTKTLTLKNESTGEITNKNIEKSLDDKFGTGNNPGLGQKLDVAFADMGVTISLDSNFNRGVDFKDDSTFGVTGNAVLNDLKVTTNYNGTTIDPLKAVGGFNAATGEISLALTSAGGNLSFDNTAGLEFSFDGGTTFTATPTGTDIVSGGAKSVQVRVVGETDTAFTIDTSSIASGVDGASTIDIDLGMDNVFGVSETVTDTSTFDYQVGTGTGASDVISVTVQGATTTSLGINASSIATQTKASNAIDEIGDAIDTLQDVRANVGASLSRLEFASSNLSVAVENSESAKSGLLDVDVASETTKYTAEQVIVQAGVSLLAQANQRPNTLLKLLQQ